MADDDAAPPASTWQLLFGKNRRPAPGHEDNQRDGASTAPGLRRLKAMTAWDVESPSAESSGNNNNHNNDDDEKHERGPETTSPSVADQLLRALATRERRARPTPEEQIGRECSEALLGKRNAFVPELGGPVGASPHELDGGVAHRAKQIIQARFEVEDRATAIRRNKQQQQHSRPVRVAATATTTSIKGTAERLTRLRAEQTRREQDEATLERAAKHKKPHTIHTTKKSAVAADERERTGHRVTAAQSTTSNQAMPATDKKIKPAKTAHRRDLVQDGNYINNSRSESPITTAQVGDGPALLRQQQQLMDDKLRRLHQENARALEAEERRHREQRIREIQGRVWTLWRQHVARSHRRIADLAQALAERRLRRLLSAWRELSRRLRHESRVRAAKREEQARGLADGLYRRKQLPRWFFRWRAAALAAREHAQRRAEQDQRRAKAQELVARLAKNHLAGGARDGQEAHDDDRVAHAQSSSPRYEPTEQRTKTRRIVGPQGTTRQGRERRTETDGRPCVRYRATTTMAPQPTRSSPTTAAVTPPPPPPSAAAPTSAKTDPAPSPPVAVVIADPLYVAMQERAAERKARREQLRQKYAELEAAKREALAQQLAEREALLAQQRLVERQQIQERRREDARRAREQAAQRELAEARAACARHHNRQRLLVHYGFRPWQRRWARAARVAANATAWHQLRTLFRAWRGWEAFVGECRRHRRRLEQLQWDAAVGHHSRWLLRHSMRRWRAYGELLTRQALAVTRQRQWNAQRRWWRRWQHALALCVRAEREREAHARVLFGRCGLRGILGAWRQVAAELRDERLRQLEKERMWKKVKSWLNE